MHSGRATRELQEPVCGRGREPRSTVNNKQKPLRRTATPPHVRGLSYTTMMQQRKQSLRTGIITLRSSGEATVKQIYIHINSRFASASAIVVSCYMAFELLFSTWWRIKWNRLEDFQVYNVPYLQTSLNCFQTI